MRLEQFFDGKKFMWDGTPCDKESEALETQKKYAGDGFETRIIQEEGKYYLFTRRTVRSTQ